MVKYSIGCSGFLYDSWRDSFYPKDLPQKKWLSFYVKKFNTVELNVTFYRLLKKEAFERWRHETPPQFSFTLKGSRFITHIKKLKDVELPLSTFFHTTSPLLEKLEVVLWQLPPNFVVNLKSLGDFIEAIKQYRVRHVFEFRHKSWINRKVFKMLSESNIAICMADWPEFINELPLTADFVYIRRHGEAGSYATNYSTEQLKKDAKRIKNYLKLDKDVYIYFNNDAFGYAPKNAMELRDILEASLPKTLREETALTKRVKPKKTQPKKKKKKPAKKRPVKKAKPKKRVSKKVKPTKKVAKKIIRKPKKLKKKKPVRKLKPAKKTKPKKITPKKVSRKPLKKTVKKKLIRGKAKKKLAKKITKKKATKKPIKTKKKPVKKKPARKTKSKLTKKKRR